MIVRFHGLRIMLEFGLPFIRVNAEEIATLGMEF